MPVKAGVVRAGSRVTKQGAAATFHRRRVPRPGRRHRGAVADGRVGRHLHPRRTHRLARPPGRADALLPLRGRPDLFEGEAPQVLNPGDVVNIPAQYPALARRLARTGCSRIWHCRKPGRRARHVLGKHVSDTEYATPATAPET